MQWLEGLITHNLFTSSEKFGVLNSSQCIKYIIYKRVQALVVNSKDYSKSIKHV